MQCEQSYWSCTDYNTDCISEVLFKTSAEEIIFVWVPISQRSVNFYIDAMVILSLGSHV